MGDRGNIFFVDTHEGNERLGMYMYSHWGGASVPAVVRAALERGRERWGDAQYFARIVFCELIRDHVLEDTGFGLSTRIGDNEHAIVRVDDVEGTVSVCEPGTEHRMTPGLGSWTYEEFLRADTRRVDMLFSSEMPEDELEFGEDIQLPAAKAKPKKAAKGKSAKASAKAKPAAKASAKAKPATKAKPAAKKKKKKKQ